MNSATAFDTKTNGADPRQARWGTAGMAGRMWRALGVVQALIEYGKQLAAKIRQGDIGPDVTRHFGTIDIALILSRITHGLQLAAALEDRLAAWLTDPPAVRAATGAPAVRRPRVAPLDNRDSGTNITGLPTAAQIAAQMRRRPIGAVLADIARDLGIVTSDPLWRELSYAIIENNGNLAPVIKDMIDRMSKGFADSFGTVVFSAPLSYSHAVSVSGARPP